MNEVKQIEEMARTLCKDYNTEKCVTRCANYGKCTVGIDANTFYFAGYRKQSEGEWIHDINNLYGCSNCLGRETMSPKKLKPYCPNCGAKMKGGE